MFTYLLTTLRVVILEDGNGKPQGWVQQPHILSEVIPVLDCVGGGGGKENFL